MPHTTARKRWRFRFSLRLLLAVVLVVALAVWAVPRWYEWYYSVPLAGEVAAFNTRAGNDRVGQYEPPITEDEIVASIRAQLPDLDASQAVKAIYSRIARTRRLPEGAALHSMNGWEMGDGSQFTVWWVNLEVVTGKNSGFGLRIRENNHPTAKPADEPVLDLPNRLWMPKKPS